MAHRSRVWTLADSGTAKPPKPLRGGLGGQFRNVEFSMHMSGVPLLVLIGTMLAGISIEPEVEEKPLKKLAFCQPEVPLGLRQANATFLVLYELEVGEKGRVVKVERKQDDYLPEGSLSTCFDQWELPGLAAGSPVSVVLQWKHGVGWTEMRVVGPDFQEVISVMGDPCPYR